MSILSAKEIRDEMSRPFPERLVITPLLEPEQQIGGSAVDVRLGNEFIITRRTSFSAINPTNKSDVETRIEQYQERVRIGFHKEFVLHPNQLILASTLEYVSLPAKLAAYVMGRSSWGRVGLIIATAAVVSPKFQGCITLELVNTGEVPLVLHPGVRIAQLVFHTVHGGGTYDGRYSCPTGPEFSKIHKDPELSFWGETPKSGM